MFLISCAFLLKNTRIGLEGGLSLDALVSPGSQTPQAPRVKIAGINPGVNYWKL